MYKEDFNEFKSILNEMTKFIIDEKGEEVISNYNPHENNDSDESPNNKFTDLNFEDI